MEIRQTPKSLHAGQDCGKAVMKSVFGSFPTVPCPRSARSGNNGPEIRDGIAYEIRAGDVVVIPSGTGHWFTGIGDHIDYTMVRTEPDKVTSLKSEAQ